MKVAAGGPDAGRHARRQEQRISGANGAVGHAGGEPADDRRLGAAACGRPGGRWFTTPSISSTPSGPIREYALRTLLAAQEAGASVLALCDTNGGTMPEQIAEAVAAVKEQTSARLGIHTHNDAGPGRRQRAWRPYRAGASHAQGTINGVGERCGNMDLIPLIANLQLKYGMDCLHAGDASAADRGEPVRVTKSPI